MFSIQGYAHNRRIFLLIALPLLLKLLQNLHPVLSCVFLLIFLFLRFLFPFTIFLSLGVVWSFIHSKKGKLIVMFSLSFFFTLSISLFLWSFPEFYLTFFFVRHSNIKERYCYLLISLQGCLLPVYFYPRSSTTM